MSALTRFVLVAERPAQKPDARAAALTAVATEMNALYGEEAEAPFRAVSEDMIQGTLPPDADPLPAILLGSLQAGRGLRWAIVADGSDPVDALGRNTRDRAVVRTGSERHDGLLEDLLPALFDQLDQLTDRQRLIARLALVDGLRQSQVAARLEVQRATVSISFERSHIASLARFASAVQRLMLRRGGASEIDLGGAKT